MDFIIANSVVLGELLVAIVLFVIGIYTHKVSLVKSSAVALMKAVRTLMATKEGSQKFDFVFDQIYKGLPAWFKKYMTESKLKIKMQKWYDKIIVKLE